MRSIRHWSYNTFNTDKCVRFIAMVTPEDLLANAEYIKLADHYIAVPGGSNNNNYANVELIVEIAREHGVDAVWAGWGHASENPKLPKLLAANGIVFLGPSNRAMWTLGDKVTSMIVAQTARVPTMPWSGQTLIADHHHHQANGDAASTVNISKELYRRGCIHSATEAADVAEKIGLFPAHHLRKQFEPKI